MIELRHDALYFSFPEVHPQAKMGITFQRTLRIPDDGKKYKLPPGLGEFPVQHIDDFASVLPDDCLIRGGVIVPMHSSEGLWINFQSNGYPIAIKVAAGKINAVTGENLQNHLNSDPQDYLIIPEQPWLDGYNVGKDVIRQFIAMPLGQGYSAEEQITGTGEYGGIQIIVCPMKPARYEALQKKRRQRRRQEQKDNITNLITDLKKTIKNIIKSTTHRAEGITVELDKLAKYLYSTDDPSSEFHYIEELLQDFRNELHYLIDSNLKPIENITQKFKDTVLGESSALYASKVSSAASMGLSPGGKMHQKIYNDKYGLNAWDQRNISRCFVTLINSSVWKAITKMDPPTKPFTAQDYNRNKLPWFDYYDSGMEAVEGANILKELKSITEMSKSKRDTPITDNESLNEENVIILNKEGVRKVRENTF